MSKASGRVANGILKNVMSIFQMVVSFTPSGSAF